MNDFRFALRLHLRKPGFAVMVVGMLALTIGATAAVFAVVHTALVRALPFASPDRLVWIASVRPDNPSAPFSLPELMDYRRRTTTIAGLAAYANWSASLFGDGLTERLTGARMTANAFEVLGVTAAAGRLLRESDDRPDAPAVVVLSYRLWQRRFGGSPGVVGETVRINGESFVVAGVMPAQFPLLPQDVDVVTPLVPERDPLRHLRNSVNFLRLFGRLRPDAEAHQAQVELSSICRSLREQFPVEYARKEAVSVASLHGVLVGDFRSSMLLLLAAVILVQAAALANLVSLALVRATGRRGELAMRMAMGASQKRLARQLAIEALVLAAAGAGLGWLLASQGIAASRIWAPPSLPRLGEVSLDGTVVALTALVAAVVAALLTAAPIAALSRAGNSPSSSRGATGDRWSHRVRHGLVVSEIAAALVLLLSTITLLQNLRFLLDQEPGFDPEGVFQARVSIPPAYGSPEDVSRFYERLSERLRAEPGVEQVGVISVAPLSGLLATVPFSIEGRPTEERDRLSANLRMISPAYLAAVGTRLLEGRSFSDTDRAESARVALVSRALAERFLEGKALGARLLIDDNNEGPRPVEIVGVIENVRQVALDLPPAIDVYLPLAQVHSDGVSGLRNNQFWVVKTRSDAGAFGPVFLSHLRAVDPDAAVSDTGTMHQYLDRWLGPRRFNLGLFGAFASTAVLLAVSGLYGLVAYAVGQRAPEIGLRLAIGATQSDVQRMFLRNAAGLGLTGVVMGLCAAFAMRPLLASLVREVHIQPGEAAGTAALLMFVVLVAAWLPARRAARIEPTLTLKGD